MSTAYGCHNMPRPLSGADVHETNGAVVAMTNWNGLDGVQVPDGLPVPCHYHGDEYCKGCKHVRE